MKQKKEKRLCYVVAFVEQEEVKGQKTGTNFSVACPTTFYIKHYDALPYITECVSHFIQQKNNKIVVKMFNVVIHA